METWIIVLMQALLSAFIVLAIVLSRRVQRPLTRAHWIIWGVAILAVLGVAVLLLFRLVTFQPPLPASPPRAASPPQLVAPPRHAEPAPARHRP